MSKFDPLWKWIHINGSPKLELSFSQIEEICGVPIDHSFLQYKKELLQYGFQVGKISMKAEKVTFEKMENVAGDGSFHTGGKGI